MTSDGRHGQRLPGIELHRSRAIAAITIGTVLGAGTLWPDPAWLTMTLTGALSVTSLVIGKYCLQDDDRKTARTTAERRVKTWAFLLSASIIAATTLLIQLL